ncbi:HepT-like ribonuclease domain-containing protein [Laspinema olomoucense]|uniref:HepT-like ribonuclease domain-containing protein n=1 Tax=Laspinema olomoucense TaxID=3231600 RepID=UPI0021BB0126|nr:HepT-like ribonuclease domain-containing protein [Laspinema sp. D3d]MCT7974641.1 DUF86 domain-containing protein [Laspinema sp. D3d]
MRRETERLQDIWEAISAIERYANQGRQVFDEQELIQVWIVHHLQIIGEAANSLSSELRNQYSQIPWPQIIAFRNILVHEYFRISLNLVWAIVQNNLPPLKVTVERKLQELEQE